jgi:hypothetical protein
MKKQNLEMLQLLESIEVMLQNGNSIHPDSVIRGAIRIAIGMDKYGMPEGLDTPEKHEQYLKDIGLMKQTAVEWFVYEIFTINRWMPLTPNGLNDIVNKAKEMEREQMIELWNIAVTCESFEQYYKETFKSE